MTTLLVVDDSPLMRRLLTDIFTEAGFDVHVARDGREALERLHTARPDVVTLDVHMPGMDGLACLDRIMVERPTPVLMFSALTEEGAQETLDALDLGAVDFVPKPDGAISLKIEDLAPMLVERVTSAVGARLSRARRLVDRVRTRAALVNDQPKRPIGRNATPTSTWRRPDGEVVVVVGTSTGGPPALEALLSPLPADFPWPIVVAQHMPQTFTRQLALRMDRLCALSVSEVTRPTPLQPGNVYIGRGDADLLLVRRKAGLVAMAAPSSPDSAWHPSVDRLVESAMSCLAPENLIGVLMTGMGSDGARTMTRLREEGGYTLAEAEETAVVWGMPGALVTMGGASRTAPLDKLASQLQALARSA